MLLRPIEGYWAFPGRHYPMTSSVGLKKAITFVPTKVRRINRMLSDKTYRHRPFNVG